MKSDDQKQGVDARGEIEYLHRRVLELEQERFLRGSNTLLRQIAANYPSSYMSIIEKDLTIGFSSGQEFKKQGLNPESFIGLTLDEVFGEKATMVREYYLRTFNGEETSFELFINNQYQLYKTVPLQNDTGEIERILVVVENITEQKLTEIALRQSEDQYRTLFETMAQGVVYQDADGSIISANPAAERILGLTLDQMQGRTSLDLRWHAVQEDGTDFPGETHPAMVALKTGKEIKNVVMGVFHSTEEAYHWININAVPQFHQGKEKPYQVYTTFEDITERKRAENQAERIAQEWETTFDAISDGIFLMDARYRVLRCNRALIEMVGKSYDEILGVRCWEIVHNAQESVSACPMLQMKKTGTRAEEVLFLNERWFNVYIDPMKNKDGKLIGSVHVMSDITEKKKAEDALQQRTYELGERVKELNCLYGISALIETPNSTLGEILQGTADLIPPAWQYPEITCARITLDGRYFMSKNFNETQWQQTRQILVHGEQSGSIEVYYLEEKPEMNEGPFLIDERNLLNAIAERLGRVAERIMAQEELMRLATTDPLTGIFNRRHFFSLAEKEMERTRRYKHPLACIMFDIDSFKEINDTYGHVFGDQVLREVVRCCQLSLRQIDVFARFGGDEFIILLPETDFEAVQQVAQRLKDSLRKMDLEIDSQRLSLTLSVGIASIADGKAETLDTMVNRADQALYRSKRSGKNRVSSWMEK